MSFAELSQRVFNAPLAIHPQKAGMILAAVGRRFGVDQVIELDGQSVSLALSDYEVGEPQPTFRRDSAYDLVEGAAIIPVRGTLVQRSNCLTPYSGMTGYDGLRQNFLMALRDPEVEGIVLDIDSGGGEVAGLFDLVDTIYEARGEKPIRAICAENAFSAAYALASAADPGGLSVPRTGGTGSCGVIFMHAEMSRALAGAGVKVTVFRSAEFKATVNDVEALTEAAIDTVNAEVAEAADLFIETVARNRGMAASKVRATKAACFQGAHGVDIGFADAVMAPDAAFRSLLKKLG